MASLVARWTRAVAKSWAEGAWRGPFFGRGELGHLFELNPLEDGYQRHLDVSGYGVRHVPAAFAAVMANANAVAQCWPRHLRESSEQKGRFDRVTTSAAFRIFREPNGYESWPVFILNLVAAMQFDGTGYAVALRNDRLEVTSLHRMPLGSMHPIVSPEDGSIYYTFGANQMLPQYKGALSELDFMIPARDVMALRQFCPRHPLMGESPAAAAAMALGINVALSRSQAVFFSRMSRPSGVLVSDQPLNKEQIARLRENWNAQSNLMAQGGVPILGNGVKWNPMVISSEDSQLIEAQRLSIEDIARVYRVPLPIIGDLTHATLTNVESLISFWLSTGLGSLLELVEKAFDKLFQFDTVTDYTDFDTNALLRTDFAGRIEALTKAIQGGLYTPNEARAREGLHPVADGDKPYVQQQMVPLGTMPAPPPAPAPAPGPQEEPPEPAGDDEPEEDEDTPEEQASRLLARLRLHHPEAIP